MRKLACMLAVVFVMGLVASMSYADINDGIVGYWPLEGNGDDSSGNGSNGTIVGDPGTVNGMVGKALDFNGDDGVEIASNANVELPDAFTVTCWVYPRATRDAAGNDHAGVVWKGKWIGWGTDVYNYRIATSGDGGLTFGACGGGTESHFNDAACFVDGMDVWYHVAYTADGTVGIAYVNGAEVNRRADTITYDTLPDQPVRIGWAEGRGGDGGADVYFDGIIDEVVIYDRALSVDEVGMLMVDGLDPSAVEPSSKLISTWSSIKAD